MADELKCLNTASKAAGFSFCRCWLRAEEVGMEEASNPQKSSISTFVDEEPCDAAFLQEDGRLVGGDDYRQHSVGGK